MNDEQAINFLHKFMFKKVCNYVESLCGNIPNMEITKNEDVKPYGNFVKVTNKCTGDNITIITPHKFNYYKHTIGFIVVVNKEVKGYNTDYDNYKESISELMGHII